MADDSPNRTIEQIEERHLDLPFCLSGTDNRPLRKFFRSEAIESHRANLTRTYVMVDTESQKVIGFVSLMCALIEIDRNTYPIPQKPSAQRYKYHPACCIARLAVCDDYQRKGYGRELIDWAIGIVATYIIPFVGCRFVYVNSKQQSIEFYKKYGFEMIESEANKSKEQPVLFIDMSKIETQIDNEAGTENMPESTGINVS